ncbi:MAG TPA: hypothetical protein VK999_04330, partial [Methylotenera sp.]|nr:hypothetical protein [Methylotenera sp.]
IEASIILLAMPLFLLFCDRKEPLLKSLLQLYILLLIAGLMAVIAMVIGVGWTEAFGKLSSIPGYLDFASFQSRFADNAQIIADNILHPVADDDAGRVLFFGLVGMIAMTLLLGLSAAYLLILLLTWKVRMPIFASQESKAIAFFLLINIGILTVFCLQQYFVTSRYCVMAFVALFLLVLPRLTAFIDTIYVQRKRGLQVLVALLLIYSLGDVVYQSNSKTYIPQTAKWAAEQLPSDSKLLTSSAFIVYYADKYAGDDLNISLHPTLEAYQEFDYVVSVEKLDDRALNKQLTSMSLQAMFSYENERGDKASVYQVLKPTKPSN